MKLLEAIRLYITVSRWEFLPAVLIGIFIGIFIGADSLQTLFSLTFLPYLLEGILIFIILFNVGFMVNCWADWKVDELYKTALYKSVMKIGRKALGFMVAFHIVLAIIFSAHLSLILQRIELSILVWIGTFLGVGYSIEPFRFKKRGILHSLIALPIFFIPGIYSYFLVNNLSISDPFTIIFLIVAIGITLGHYALILVSQAEDQPADKKMNLYTPAVTWGLKKTIYVSFMTNLIGSILIVIGLILMFLTLNIWLLLLVPFIIIGRYFSMIEVYRMHKHIKVLDEDTVIIKHIRSRMEKYPLWHAYGLSGITLSSLIILLIKSFGYVHPVLPI